MSSRKIVKILDNTPTRMLKFVFNPETGQYFVPYNPPLDKIKKIRKGKLTEKEAITTHPLPRDKIIDVAPLGFSLAAEGLTGEGITVAVLDTGILLSHPLLSGKIIDSVDFTGEGSEDLNGHGTVVSLILSIVAPKANILNVKVLNKNGKGLEKNLVSGMRWAAKHDVDVINLSLGIERECNGTCAVCREAEKIILNSGVIFCAAAGNHPDAGVCPANCKEVIAVEATDYSGIRIADYSGVGEVYAPGTVIMVSLE